MAFALSLSKGGAWNRDLQEASLICRVILRKDRKGSDTGQLGPSPTRILLEELWRMFFTEGAPEGRNTHDS